jgi:hypothetical protein
MVRTVYGSRSTFRAARAVLNQVQGSDNLYFFSCLVYHANKTIPGVEELYKALNTKRQAELVRTKR